MLNTSKQPQWLKLPKMVEKAIAINKKNGSTLWEDDIENEMKNMKIALHIILYG